MLTPGLVELTFWHCVPFRQSSYVAIGLSEPSSSGSCGSQVSRSCRPAGCTALNSSGAVQSTDAFCTDAFRSGVPLGLLKERITPWGGVRSMSTSKGPSSSLSPSTFSARMTKVRASDSLTNAMECEKSAHERSSGGSQWQWSPGGREVRCNGAATSTRVAVPTSKHSCVLLLRLGQSR